jgi:hypothetical protein
VKADRARNHQVTMYTPQEWSSTHNPQVKLVESLIEWRTRFWFQLPLAEGVRLVRAHEQLEVCKVRLSLNWFRRCLLESDSVRVQFGSVCFRVASVPQRFGSQRFGSYRFAFLPMRVTTVPTRFGSWAVQFGSSSAPADECHIGFWAVQGLGALAPQIHPLQTTLIR